MDTNNYDIDCLTETWLHANIPSSEYFGNNFSVYRHDRDAVKSGKRFGGGVMTAVNADFVFYRREDLGDYDECVRVEVSMKDK